MSKRHGAKIYVQLLLDPNRAELVEEIATANGVRPTALMRDLIYDQLKHLLPASVYNKAEAQDAVLWKESVKNRVEGRYKKQYMEKQVNKVLEELKTEET